MNPLKKRRALKRLRQRAKELEGIRDTAIKKRDVALREASESLERIREAMRIDVGSETGVLRVAQNIIWEIRQDLHWPQMLKRCEIGLSFAQSGTSATMAEEAVLGLQQLADGAAARCAGQMGILTAVRNARACADGLADVLVELPSDDVDRMIMCAPALAEAVFRQKRQIASDAQYAEEILGASLQGRRRQLGLVAQLPHRRRLGHRAKSLLDLALSGGDGRGVSELHMRHESVGAAATAIHKDQFGRWAGTVGRRARRTLGD